MSSNPSAASRTVPAPGDVVAGKYRVESVLGEGGMGVVLAAVHEELGRRVALKFLHPDPDQGEEALERFRLEARILASSDSEHVAKILDVCTSDGGAPYLVMERLDGRDLAATLRARGALAIEEAVEIVRDACIAMEEAHENGVVHRDLKPSNLFLADQPDGRRLLKVLDFGIAKLVDRSGSRDLTTTGSLMGSPAYMSPEQIRNARTIDARTDVWSLGVVLYEALTGAHPFEGETATAISAAIVADPPTPIASVRAAVPPDLARIVHRCLEKQPARRTHDVKTLREELDRFLAAPAKTADLPPARARGAVGLVVAVVALACAVGAVVWARTARAPAPVPMAEVNAPPPLVEAPTPAPEAPPASAAAAPPPSGRPASAHRVTAPEKPTATPTVAPTAAPRIDPLGDRR